MIIWNDFILDDFFGPVLNLTPEPTSCRKTRLDRPSTRNGVMGATTGQVERQIQETGQENRSARMVDLSNTDFRSVDLVDMDVDWSDETNGLWQKEEG